MHKKYKRSETEDTGKEIYCLYSITYNKYI